MYSGRDLVEFAKRAKENGVKYLYGANYEVLTPSRLDYLRSQYPNRITENRYNIAKNNYIGKTVTDCSGLIYGYMKDPKRRTSAKLFQNASKRVEIDKNKISDIPVGAILYKDGHVGINQGNGKSIEAIGFDYGIGERDIKNSPFTHYLLFDDFEYNKQKFPWWLLVAGGIGLLFIFKK